MPNYTPTKKITISIVLSDISTNYLNFQQVTEDWVSGINWPRPYYTPVYSGGSIIGPVTPGIQYPLHDTACKQEHQVYTGLFDGSEASASGTNFRFLKTYAGSAVNGGSGEMPG